MFHEKAQEIAISPKGDKPQNFANITQTVEEPVKASPKMAPEGKKSSSSVGRKTGIIMAKKQEDSNSLIKKFESKASEINSEQKSTDKPLDTSVKKGGVLAAASMFQEKAEEVAKSHEALISKPSKSVLQAELKVEKSSALLATASKFEEKPDESKPLEQKPKEEPKSNEESKPLEKVKSDEIKPVTETQPKEETKPIESPKSTDSKPTSPKSKDNNSKPRTKKDTSKKNITKKEEKKTNKT